MIQTVLASGTAGAPPLQVHLVGGAGTSTSTTVLVALAGVALGGLLTFLGQASVERIRTGARLRAAAQLLGPDLIAKQMAIIALRASPVWQSPDAFSSLLDREAWRESRAELGYGDREMFLTLIAAYNQLGHVEQQARAKVGQGLDQSAHDLLESTMSSLTQALVFLGTLHEPPRWFQLGRQIRFRRDRRVAIRNARAARMKQSQLLAASSRGQKMAQADDPAPGAFVPGGKRSLKKKIASGDAARARPPPRPLAEPAFRCGELALGPVAPHRQHSSPLRRAVATCRRMNCTGKTIHEVHPVVANPIAGRDMTERRKRHAVGIGPAPSAGQWAAASPGTGQP